MNKKDIFDNKVAVSPSVPLNCSTAREQEECSYCGHEHGRDWCCEIISSWFFIEGKAVKKEHPCGCGVFHY